jgi:hypothetical protein
MNDDESTLNNGTVKKPFDSPIAKQKVKNSCGQILKVDGNKSEKPLLKPCPFCGTIPTLNDDTFIYNPIIDDSVIDEHIIFCPNAACGVAPCLCGFNIPQMVETWNSRNESGYTQQQVSDILSHSLGVDVAPVSKGWTNKL